DLKERRGHRLQGPRGHDNPFNPGERISAGRYQFRTRPVFSRLPSTVTTTRRRVFVRSFVPLTIASGLVPRTDSVRFTVRRPSPTLSRTRQRLAQVIEPT